MNFKAKASSNNAVSSASGRRRSIATFDDIDMEAVLDIGEESGRALTAAADLIEVGEDELVTAMTEREIKARKAADKSMKKESCSLHVMDL